MPILSYKDSKFYLDGKEYVVISGAIHYFRVPQEYWYDRLLKLKECGFNTVETYMCWNLHEPKENQFDFSGNLDVVKFIQTAQELSLNVILRPGPFICAEWEFGGLPSWLLSYEKINLRCYDELYLSKLKRYFDKFLKLVKPYMATNGGNIIMLQIENEYGSYGDDKNYLQEIVKIYKDNGIDCLFFTSDGPVATTIRGGAMDEHLAVFNFGSAPKEQFKIPMQLRPNQPMMCGEFWCGWFDHWFEEHHVRPAEEIVQCVEDFLQMGASLNFYMFHGGTNFGFMNGANYDDKYSPTVTSYDYNAPLNEAGDRTETYYKIRDVLTRYNGEALPLTATESEKKSYGTVELKEYALLFDNLTNLTEPVKTVAPKYMEDIGQDFGYTLYRTVIDGPIDEDCPLVIEKVHDRAQIFIDGEKKGTINRWEFPENGKTDINLPLAKDDSVTLDILNENMGRVNYGSKLLDRKGINGVKISFQFHYNWEMYPLDMRDLSGLKFEKISSMNKINSPVFLRGTLEITDTPCDTFVRLDGFTKGFVMVNGINLGRYYNSAGPQKTLYLPAPFLRKGENEIIVFESDETKVNTIELTDVCDLG